MGSCKQCGAYLVEEAAFCPQCGAPVGASSATSAPDAETASMHTPATYAGPATPNGGAPSAQPRKPRKRGAIIAAVVAVVVVAVGVGAGLWWKSDQDAKAAAQAEWERTHVSLVTQVPIEAPEFDSGSTSIPIQVKGTDLDGNSVDDLQFLRPGATHVSTLPGSYNLVFPSGYFTSSGKVMKAPVSPIHIEVPVPAEESETSSGDSATSASAADSKSGASTDTVANESAASAEAISDAGAAGASASNGSSDSEAVDSTVDASKPSEEASNQIGGTVDGTATFTEVAPLDVTDEMIADIEKWTSQDPEDAGKSQALAQTATTAHQEAVAAEEARVAAEAEAARKQAELDAAYNANPSVVQAAPSRASAPVNLTGRIEIHHDIPDAGAGLVDVVLLVLPKEITVTGTQYGDITSNTIALTGADLWDIMVLEGQTVTLNTSLSIRITASIASARFTSILGSSNSVVKTFG